MGEYARSAVLFAIAGTLSTVVLIAITEGFVSAGLLALSVGTYALLAMMCYGVAVLLYIADNGARARSNRTS